MSPQSGRTPKSGHFASEVFCFRDKKLVQEELTKALEVLIENDVDMILVEYFFYIQEMEWAIELCRKVQRQIFKMCLLPLNCSVQQTYRGNNGNRTKG